MLYWGFFTIGFIFGSILAYVIFAPKNTELEELLEEHKIEQETNDLLPSPVVSKNLITG